jgi:hypothetical protein
MEKLAKMRKTSRCLKKTEETKIGEWKKVLHLPFPHFPFYTGEARQSVAVAPRKANA